VVVSIIIFLVLAVFFELVIGFGGRGIGLGGIGWLVVLNSTGRGAAGGYVLDRLGR
jgi:hypothetical protein